MLPFAFLILYMSTFTSVSRAILSHQEQKALLSVFVCPFDERAQHKKTLYAFTVILFSYVFFFHLSCGFSFSRTRTEIS